MKLVKHISNWLIDVFRVWRREFSLVFGDIGVLLFFFGLPMMYPIIYTLIYDPEIVTDIPVVVIDHSRTADSRELVRMVDATQAMKVDEYVDDLSAARRIMNEHRCFGILEIPADYAKKLGRGEQADCMFYTEMDLMLRYRTITAALADIQLAIGQKVQTKTVNSIGMLAEGMNESAIINDPVMLGDPTQGFASFVMPGIVVLILQQSIILGIGMLFGGHRERIRRYGYDPEWIDAPAGATILGKTLCYIALYIPMTLWILHLIPMIFNLPHIGAPWQFFSFIMPMLIASIMFGMCIAQFVKDRETSLLLIVFTSVIFLFLSGITWPRYAMNPFWQMVGSLIPATWGIDGFININNNGATLYDVSRQYIILWGLVVLYGTLAYGFIRLARNRKPHQSTAI